MILIRINKNKKYVSAKVTHNDNTIKDKKTLKQLKKSKLIK